VVAVLGVVALQVGCLAVAFGRGGGTGLATIVLAAAVGRLAITTACRHGVPSARPDGLGAWVAGTVPAWAAALVVLAVAAVGYGLRGWYGLAAVPVALGCAELMLRHIRRRLGGVTGDVLGALTETATTAALVVLAH
jgi:adenosylcobinamide-GDP ribazoletransferase